MSDENIFTTEAEATEENSEIIALEARISEEENNIDRAIFELGDAYARKYSTNFDPDFTPFFNRIFSAQNNIGMIQAEIREMKGLTLCVNCKHEYPKDAPACPVCQCPNPDYIPPAPPVPEAEPVLCAACGAPIAEGNLFCTNCGTKVEVAPEVAPVEAKPTCANCGAELREGAAFCTQCGTKVAAEPVVTEKLCAVCGAKLQPTDIFCTQCGTKAQ